MALCCWPGSTHVAGQDLHCRKRTPATARPASAGVFAGNRFCACAPVSGPRLSEWPRHALGIGCRPVNEPQERRPWPLAAASRWRPWACWLGAAGCAAALVAGAGVLAPGIALSPIAAYLVGFAAVCGQTLMVSSLAPPASARALPVLLMPAAALLAVQASNGMGLWVAAAITAGLLLGGTLLGAVIGRGVQHPGHLLFVALVSGAADVFSLYSPLGPTGAVVRHPQALQLLALPWPMLGTEGIESFLGVGDVVFASLYLATSRLHRLGYARTVLALCAAFTVTAALVVAWETPIPALPILGTAVVLVHPEARRPARSDRRSGLLALVLVALVAVALLLLFPR